MSMTSSTQLPLPLPSPQVSISAFLSTHYRRARSRRVFVALSHCQPCSPVSISPQMKHILYRPSLLSFPCTTFVLNILATSWAFLTRSWASSLAVTRSRLSSNPRRASVSAALRTYPSPSGLVSGYLGVWATAAEGYTFESGPGGAEEAAVGCERHRVVRVFFLRVALFGRRLSFVAALRGLGRVWTRGPREPT